MSDWDNIKQVREIISDPQDFISLETVVNPAALPAAPEPQTAYRVESTGGYYYTTKTAGATSVDYEFVELLISDAQILSIISTVGITKAPVRALCRIVLKLHSQCNIVKNQNGIESNEYVRLLELYKYYKAIIGDLEDIIDEDSGNNTGLVGKSYQPEIGGDNL